MLPFKDLVPFSSFGIAKVVIILELANFIYVFYAVFVLLHYFRSFCEHFFASRYDIRIFAESQARASVSASELTTMLAVDARKELESVRWDLRRRTMGMFWF